METTPHPLEKFPGATKTITLPQTGIHVVIRRVDIEVFTIDATRTVLNRPALQQVAREWAERANAAAEAAQAEEGQTRRPQPELPPEAVLDIQMEGERALLRTAILRPTLDELVNLYGGSMTAPDLGLGPDFGTLTREIDAFSRTKVGEPEVQRAQVFPDAERQGAAPAGDGVPSAAQ